MSISTLASALRLRRRAARRIHRDLASLDDRMLVDIGLIRAELRSPRNGRRLGRLDFLDSFTQVRDAT
jgi:hypothetical protein